MTEQSFGPNALLTPANAITLARIAMTPVLLTSIVETGDSWSTLALWIFLAGSDGIDGWLARKQGTTRSGAFLDPLADKLLVLGALICLVIEGVFWWLPVAIIAVREISLTLYRSWLGRRGISLPARWSAKVKTVVQEVAVGFALLPLTGQDATWIATSVLWLAVVLTTLSGIQYLVDARRHVVEV
ncbi:MAG TPA: CDP-diacylglycerol--glycerol-3-phosphate 3-phosphatidyltransferase [Acidimicrobiales bacterium]|nr:CDP-diacylglycerol--glycerol-3-phosphate 3-phosphatidyltransferase [Acidimicrobiales bacterium]